MVKEWFENKGEKYKYKERKSEGTKINEENKDKKNIRKIILIVTFTLLTLGIFIFAFTMNQVYEENNLLKSIMIADSDILELSIDAQQAESYYAEASYSYEDMDYKGSERNCRLARDHYFKEGQGYKRIKAELKDKEIDHKLIILYLEKLDLLSEITNNMYEACEYFESASRYYYTYFDINVPYDDASYDMADGEMDMMNEKILAHDNAVERYNNVLAEYNVELKKLG